MDYKSIKHFDDSDTRRVSHPFQVILHLNYAGAIPAALTYLQGWDEFSEFIKVVKQSIQADSFHPSYVVLCGEVYKNKETEWCLFLNVL